MRRISDLAPPQSGQPRHHLEDMVLVERLWSRYFFRQGWPVLIDDRTLGVHNASYRDPVYVPGEPVHGRNAVGHPRQRSSGSGKRPHCLIVERHTKLRIGVASVREAFESLPGVTAITIDVDTDSVRGDQHGQSRPAAVRAVVDAADYELAGS
ncbi:hypothetical protein IU501_06315 [Nocardia otitidiscaviarum]|uniref:hypothetical protein n=1 Tax=Nocardia otitidiscaviarum TaxID=1823 RepID=UPI0011DC8233|nr:hypothetical protein [Nocardia otitidiscaviarum]MBF6132612.1 hypothetical protein [Nocardia otitidiscaviarum]MBF6488713.1 hypothetical protein [Nocardia otitidiscaviarum]